MQPDVLGFANHTHTSAAQLFNDAAVRDGPADHSLPIMERTLGCNVGALQALLNGLADRRPGIDQLAASK